MNVRALTADELVEFDNGLTFFKDTEWDFSRVYNKKNDNFAYFNSIISIDPLENHNAFWAIAKTCVPFIALLVGCGFFAYSKLDATTEYEKFLTSLVNTQNTYSNKEVNYVEGTPATKTDIIAVSKLLSNYFSSDVTQLNQYCNKSSLVNLTYQEALKNMKTMHDVCDMQARYVKASFDLYDLGTIDKLIIDSNGVYHCYFNATRPTMQSANDYALTNVYHYTKHFQSQDYNNADLLNYTLTLINEQPMIVEQGIDCIKLRKNEDGSFSIEDDTEVLKNISDNYKTLIRQLIKLIQNI